MSDPTAPTPTTTSTRRRHRRMGCQIALLLAVVLVVLTAYVCRRLWMATPTYWTQNETFLKTKDNTTLIEMADRAEQRLLAELTDAGSDTDAGSGGGPATAPPVPGAGVVPAAVPGTGAGMNAVAGTNLNQSRTIHLSLAEVNAWLAVKLETWAAYQNITLPPQLNGYMVTTEGQNLVFAFQYKGPDFSQVISVVFHVDMLPDGQACLKIESLRGGELPLPKGLALSQVKGSAGDDARADEIGRTVALIDGKVFSPVHRLDAARQIRLLGYTLRPDGADVTVRTELRPGVTLPENTATQP